MSSTERTEEADGTAATHPLSPTTYSSIWNGTVPRHSRVIWDAEAEAGKLSHGCMDAEERSKPGGIWQNGTVRATVASGTRVHALGSFPRPRCGTGCSGRERTVRDYLIMGRATNERDGRGQKGSSPTCPGAHPETSKFQRQLIPKRCLPKFPRVQLSRAADSLSPSGSRL